MASVGANLAAHLFDENPAAGITPAGAGYELGQRSAYDVEAERLAGQMSVRAEVDRQIVLDVRELAIQGDHQVHEPRWIAVSVLPEQEMQSPGPGDRAQGDLEHAGPVDPQKRRVGRRPIRELADQAMQVGR